MDPTKEGFGAFQYQLKKNQEELQDYLKELDSWKESISKTDEDLRAGKDVTKSKKPSETSLPPVRNSLHKKKKLKKRKDKLGSASKEKPGRISGYDFRSWDKFDVNKALEDVDKSSESSSYDEETDEEWEDERRKQQAVFEKDQGNDYFKRSKYAEAIECYTRGVQCDPTNAMLYANRAMALLKQEKYGAAEKDCTDAIALDPAYVKAYMRRATARKNLKKMQSALDDFKQVLKLEPDNKMAAREIAVIEQELEISRQGLVLPINKSPKDRSKKPLVRIDIQEIDYDDVKHQLQEAVAKTLSQQSKEKQRVVARDNEMFEKLTSSPVTTKDDNAVTVLSSKESTIPNGRSSNSSAVISSPADIGKLNLSTDTTEPHQKKSSTENTSSPVNSPLSSPRAPANSFQFQRDWKTVRSDIDRAYAYLKLMQPSQYPSLFGESMEAGVMSTILKVFQTRFLRDGLDITEHLLKLSEVKRFGMTIMLMSKKDRQVVEEIIDQLADMTKMHQGDVTKLKKLYEL